MSVWTYKVIAATTVQTPILDADNNVTDQIVTQSKVEIELSADGSKFCETSYIIDGDWTTFGDNYDSIIHSSIAEAVRATVAECQPILDARIADAQALSNANQKALAEKITALKAEIVTIS